MKIFGFSIEGSYPMLVDFEMSDWLISEVETMCDLLVQFIVKKQ